MGYEIGLGIGLGTPGTGIADGPYGPQLWRTLTVSVCPQIYGVLHALFVLAKTAMHIVHTLPAETVKHTVRRCET